LKETEISPEMERILQRIQELERQNVALIKIVDQYEKELTDMTALQAISNQQLREAADLINSIMEQDGQQGDQIGIMPDCVN
jgi:flagellar biosynthesis/type III secretory pathway M-ring protein FliF/YscJ